MDSIIKKMLLTGFALLLSACVPYPQRYSYYSGHDAYSSGYIMHRNHYGERPDHYDNGYDRGRAYFPPHYQHNDHDHYDNDGNYRQHDNHGNRRNNFGRRDYH